MRPPPQQPSQPKAWHPPHIRILKTAPKAREAVVPEQVVVSDDLALSVGGAHAALTPAEAFAVAERLIRAATAAIVLDAADAALVRAVVAGPAAHRRCSLGHAHSLTALWGRLD
jgi:hypothetical protein